MFSDCSVGLAMPLSLLMVLGAVLCPPRTAIAEPDNFAVQTVATTPMRLCPTEIEAAMVALPDWTLVEETLVYEREFGNFVEAVAFVNRLVDPAEQLGHHPDITIHYNRVRLELTTHDAGGLTELDLQLARQIAQL